MSSCLCGFLAFRLAYNFENQQKMCQIDFKENMFRSGEFHERSLLKSCICVRRLKFTFKYGGYEYSRKVLIREKMANFSIVIYLYLRISCSPIDQF